MLASATVSPFIEIFEAREREGNCYLLNVVAIKYSMKPKPEIV